MIRSAPERLARRSAWLALVGLALMSWSVLSPRPIPVVLAMTVGQLVGTLSLLMFVIAVVKDLRTAHVLRNGKL